MHEKIAIIGAGVAGLAAARDLEQARFEVRLFDKGRSAGGRLATRRVAAADDGEVKKQWLFDHGAQFISAREPRLRALLEGLVASGTALHWQGRERQSGDDLAYIGVPAMSAIARAMAEGLHVRTQARVVALAGGAQSWRLLIEEGSARAWSEPFGTVIVSAPAPQAAELLRAVSSAAASVADQAIMRPCWAGLFVLPRSATRALASGPVDDDEALAWIASRAERQQTKSSGGDDCIVVHARADWSAARLEADGATIIAELGARLAKRLGQPLAPLYQSAHRWRYALVDAPAPGPHYWDPGQRLGLCGDWMVGARVEAAWSSGRSLARAILG